MNASLDLTGASENATTPNATGPNGLPPPSSPHPFYQCSSFFSDYDCDTDTLANEKWFLAVMSIILACSVCALIVLTMVMAALIQRLSTVWIKSLVRPAQTEPSDDPRKGLLQETKSSLRSASSESSNAEGKKKKKTSFAAGTSCAAPRDVDEEDL
jgi:hypothetical protein